MKNRAFVGYTKKGRIIPGSLILTNGSYPNKPSLWKEVETSLFSSISTSFGNWSVVTGGAAGDGAVLPNSRYSDEFMIVGPNDGEDTGWVYLKQYFPTGASLEINYKWTTFDEDAGPSTPIHDRPVYWTSSTEPIGAPTDITSKVGESPEFDTWNVTVNPGEWFAIGIYSDDSCCGQGLLQVKF